MEEVYEAHERTVSHMRKDRIQVTIYSINETEWWGKMSSAELCLCDTQPQSLLLLVPYTASSSVY